MSTTRVGILDENKEYFWKTVNGVRTKVGPGWRNVSIAYAKVDGEWKEVYVRPGPTVRNFRIDPVTNDSVTFQWYAGPNVEKSELWVASRSVGTTFALEYTKALEINSTYVTPSGQAIVLTQGSDVVTGINTNFNNLVPENIIYTIIDSERTLIGTVKSVESATSLTLKSEWTGISTQDPETGDTFIYQTNNSYLYNTNRETEYYFYLVPIELVGTELVPGDKSNTIQRTTPVGPPPPITDLSIVSQDGRAGTFTLGWTPSPRYKTDAYAFYDDGGSSSTSVTTLRKIFTSTDGRYSSTVTGTGATYEIQIEAFNSLGEGSGKSNLVSFLYQPIVAKTLTSPTISGYFEPTSGNTSNWNRITISWFSNPADHDYYELWAKPASSSTWSFVSRIEMNSSDTAGTKIAYYSGPNQNTTYNVQLRTYANPPGSGYEWKVPPGTTVTSNTISFRTGQPRLTENRTGNGSKNITGTRSTTAVTTSERRVNNGSWTTTGVSTSYSNTGLVGITGGSINTTYTVRESWVIYRRTRTSIFRPWSAFSRFTSGSRTYSSSTFVSQSFRDNNPSAYGYSDSLNTDYYADVTRTTIETIQTRTQTVHTTRYDFSASAIQLGGGETLNSSTLSIPSTGGAYSINVNVGGTNFSEIGSVFLNTPTIYNRLIISINFVTLTRNTSPLASYGTGTVGISYSWTYTVVTQNFGAPALV